ncbi:probable cytochrome P450 6a13 [Pollicipes pollicipes]|uniref:probable cytochrome P450 6a13 n=1 Tax=Pollicipes pollicipes TaxID=41117 RepID=UPI0018855FE0|nr:probable cytochrome P450 6a13 [Pollicipes pollicipes]
MVGWVSSVVLSVLSWLFSPLPLAVLAVLFVCVYFYVTRHFDFWRSRGVSGPTARFPWGTEMGPPFWTPFVTFEEWLYHKQGGKNICGYFELCLPVLYVGNLDLIQRITIKDFEYFTDRRELVLSEVLSEILLALNGETWKDARSVMSPTFSASKLKGMLQLCLENASNLNAYVQDQMKMNGEIELKDCFGRFTMDNIASCAFGVNCNSFKDTNSEFAKNAQELFKTPRGYAGLRAILIRLLGLRSVRLLPDPIERVNAFFRRIVKDTLKRREAGNSRKDFLQLLLETKDKNGKRILSDSSIVSQSVMFFIVGYDTTASLLAFAAYCLATSPDVQNAVHREIDDVLQRHGGQLTYDAVAEMTYLDRVLSETLRLYPPAIRMERQCSRDYTLPDTNVHIPRGTTVQMPILNIHRDPEHYPDPLRFDPDRFLPEAKEERHPCAFVPFGSGPRNCIAMRFALFEAKVALIAVLRENRLEPSKRTPPPPMPHSEETFLLTPKEGMGFLRAVPREMQ